VGKVDQYPVIIMHGIPQEKLAIVMRAVRAALGTEVVFSITTETNLEWGVKDLVKELILEHEYMRKFRDQNKNKQ